LLVVSIFRWIFSDLASKIVALIFAVFLWFLAVLDRSYTTTFEVPIVLHDVQTKKIISEFQTQTATVQIEGKGKDLLGLRIRQPQFRVTVPEARAGVQLLRLNPADLQLPAQLVVRSITPDYIELKLNDVGNRRVRVEVPERGQPQKGMTVSSVVPLTEVTLVGPVEDMSLYPTVATESLDLAALRGSDTFWLLVSAPDAQGFSVDPGSVQVAVQVEKEAARIFLGVPVKAAGAEGADVSLEPTEAQIAVAGPQARLEPVKLEDIVAQVKVAGLSKGKHRIAAEILLPDGIHLVKCEPALFEVTVR